MHIFHGFKKCKWHEELRQGTVVSLGVFDGLHVGHRKLCVALLENAYKRKLPGGVIAFNASLKSKCLVTSENDRRALLADIGIDFCIEVPAADDVFRLTASEFIRDYLKKSLRAVCVVVGENFRFGKDRTADIKDLVDLCKQFKIECLTIPVVRLQDHIVSSSSIRHYLAHAMLDKAEHMLGRPFSITGVVLPGVGIGATLGVKTANLHMNEKICLPDGVYFTYTILLGSTINLKYPSISNVKVNLVETHILDKSIGLYGRCIKLEFVKKLRDEMEGIPVSELAPVIKKDIMSAKEFFKVRSSGLRLK